MKLLGEKRRRGNHEKAFCSLIISHPVSPSSPPTLHHRPQLIDVATATQTQASREAILDLLNFHDADAIDYPQRFLFAAAYASHPDVAFIKELMVRIVEVESTNLLIGGRDCDRETGR